MKRFIFFAIITAFITSCHTGNNISQNSADTTAAPTDSVSLQLVTGDIHSPVELKESPDNTGRLFVCDLGGRVFILRNGQLQPRPFLDIRDRLEKKDTMPNIRAMFGLTFSPNFTTDRQLYVSYNAPTAIDSNICKLKIARFTVSATNPDSVDMASEKTVFEVEGHTVQQDAGELVFGPDGYLYISVGDNGTPMKDRHAEELGSYLGKLLRIDVSTLPYKIPADNPFIHAKNAHPEIYAYGLRRFWRFMFEPKFNAFIGGDIGDKLQEEVDLVTKGGNYGWPYIEGDSVRVNLDSLHAKPSDFISPVATYGRKDGICVQGGTIYGGGIPWLKGKYVFADFNGSLYYLVPQPEKGTWPRHAVPVAGKGKWPLVIYSFNTDTKGDVYLSGVLNTGKGQQGVVYKVVSK